jgi:hypothetical protein
MKSLRTAPAAAFPATCQHGNDLGHAGLVFKIRQHAEDSGRPMSSDRKCRTVHEFIAKFVDRHRIVAAEPDHTLDLPHVTAAISEGDRDLGIPKPL